MWFSRRLMPDDLIIISELVRVLYLVGFALYILRYRLLGRPFVESLFCDETSWTRAVSWRFSWFFFWFLCCGFHFRSLHVVVRSFCVFWCLSARCSAYHMLYLTVPRSCPGWLWLTGSSSYTPLSLWLHVLLYVRMYFLHSYELVVIDGDLLFLINIDWRHLLPRHGCECFNF